MSKLAKALTAAAGNAGGDPLYVEDVFSTYLYTANNSAQGDGNTQTINNGLDLSGEGGLVWIKKRGDDARSHVLMDTERGATKALSSNTTSAERTDYTGTDGSGTGAAFTSTGFTVGDRQEVNAGSGDDFCSWTFRKAEKFFDIVTYTGDGVAGRTVAHNLGSVPACIIVKNISLSGYYWQVYHTSTGNTDYLNLNDTDATASFIGAWNNTSPTSTHFTLGNWAQTNDAAGSTYVAYLFASDAGGFGDDGSENVISCGSYSGNGSATGPVVDLGYEPQWVMVKQSSASGQWWNMIDVMRGFNVSTGAQTLGANASDAEYTNAGFGSGTPIMSPTATGFQVRSAQPATNASGETYIYIAIRRPMKTPESGTEVFGISEGGTTSPGFISSFPVDAAIGVSTDASNHYLSSRLTNKNYMLVTSTAAEAANSYFSYTFQNGYYDSTSGATELAYMFKRATGFFDVVAYTGDGTYDGSYNVNHNLTVAPEMIIAKSRNNADYWSVYHTGLTSDTYQINMNLASTQFSSGQSWGPISTTFKPQYAGNANYSKNHSGRTYIAYLFATLAGVSKVGSYTGTGADLNVDCGFSAGARFILIKRTDDTGDWYVYDSVRGIVVGNDPYLLLNTTAAQVTNTDYIDPLSSGFTVTSSAPAALNASGGTYIFLAIA